MTINAALLEHIKFTFFTLDFLHLSLWYIKCENETLESMMQNVLDIGCMRAIKINMFAGSFSIVIMILAAFL